MNKSTRVAMITFGYRFHGGRHIGTFQKFGPMAFHRLFPPAKFCPAKFIVYNASHRAGNVSNSAGNASNNVGNTNNSANNVDNTNNSACNVKNTGNFSNINSANVKKYKQEKIYKPMAYLL